MNFAITAWEYSFDKNFDVLSLEHRDSRLMDKQTKIGVSMARRLFAKIKGDKIPSHDIGVVLLNDIGPMESISEYTSVLKERGYTGINPSKFPNIMPATPLSRIAIEIGAKGPCIPLLLPQSNKHALIYAIEQIATGRCRSMMLIHINNKNNCFGCFIENEDLCHKRDMQPMLIISEKGWYK